MKPGKIFILFMGWFIFYSLLYFISIDIAGTAPGKESAGLKLFNYGGLFILSIAGWWLSWKKFERAFSPDPKPASGAGAQECPFALRNPAFMYYLMVLKLFLLAMGANGLITLSQHTGGARTFYIWNFVILYIYAIPFFIIKFMKLKKGLSARIVFEDDRISLRSGPATVAQIPYAAIERLALEEATGAMLVQGNNAAIYLGASQAKASPFYPAGIKNRADKMREKAADKVQAVASIKDEMKRISFAPYL